MGKFNPVDAEVITELRQIAGEKNVWLDREKMADYSHDAVTGEKYVHYPEVVVFPEQVRQVAEILQLANRRLIPVVPRGAGTGYACAAVAFDGGIVLSMERMNRFVEFDEANMVLVVEPGVRTIDVQNVDDNRNIIQIRKKRGARICKKLLDFSVNRKICLC